MTDNRFAADDAWLTSMLPFVREQLPPPPAHVVEVGCGSLGGFVPALVAAGYAAAGVDPEAPEGATFHRVAFEQFAAEQAAAPPADVVVASLSLHHVDDPGVVLDHVVGRLAPRGVVVVLEWASERFDEATARWCFARLGARTDADHDHDRDHDGHESGCWLHHMADQWRASGKPWDEHVEGWLREGGLHRGDTILSALRDRFDTLLLREGPYFFPDLEATREDELAAIRAGEVQPACLQFVGRRR